MKKKIGIIGQFPPPVHGLSKAVDTLYNSNLNNKYEFTKYNITDKKNIIYRMLEIMLSKLDVYYITISQSKFGNIRDLLILKTIMIKKKKVVIHLHGGAFKSIFDEFWYTQRKFNVLLLKKVDSAIVLGDSLRFNFEGLIEDKKIKVIKNFVDNTNILSDNIFYKKVNNYQTKSIIKILYLSNFIESKGYKDVLQLAKLIRDSKDDRFKFVFAGQFFEEKDKNWFFNYVRDNKLDEVIDYRGAVFGEDKNVLFTECDYFILLSKNEGQPLSIIEAACNGLRIITTNYPGIKDILNSDEIIECDINDIKIENLYVLLRDEYYNRESLSKVLVRNRDKMLSEFSEERYINELDEIFGSL